MLTEAAAIERVRTLARSALGAAEFDRLRAQGETLIDAQVAGIAFAAMPARP